MDLQKSIFLGHSLGAGIAKWYTSVFPETVSALIMLDLISFVPQPVENMITTARRSVKGAMKIHETLATK